jgi:hypothetical protein
MTQHTLHDLAGGLDGVEALDCAASTLQRRSSMNRHRSGATPRRLHVRRYISGSGLRMPTFDESTITSKSSSTGKSLVKIASPSREMLVSIAVLYPAPRIWRTASTMAPHATMPCPNTNFCASRGSTGSLPASM